MKAILMILTLMVLVSGCKPAAPVVTDDPAARCPTCSTDGNTDGDQINKMRALIFEKSPEIYDYLSDRDELAMRLVSFVHHNTAFVAGNTQFATVDRAENLRLILNEPGYGLLADGIAVTTMDVLTVYGFNARVVQLFSNGAESHTAVEVYLSSGWVAIDPTFNVVFTVSGDMVDYRSIFSMWRDHQQLPQMEVIDTTLRRVEDYHIPYSAVLFQGRALQIRSRDLPAANALVVDAEIF